MKENFGFNIRLETPDDYFEVENVARETFWESNWGKEPQITDIHLLVSRLRKCPSYLPELHFVAECDGKIIGHIIYTKSKVVSDDGTEYETLTFGPISVLPEYQTKGVGRELIFHSFNEAKKLGYRAVLIFGYPSYYPRVGFKYARDFGIRPAGTKEDERASDAFLIYLLYDGAMDGIHGEYHIDSAYHDLKPEDIAEYDKKFSPKELHIPESIDLLLPHLEPKARKAIETLDFPTLNVLTTKSEREIRSLDDIDDKAIDTIRAILREHGKYWGA